MTAPKPPDRESRTAAKESARAGQFRIDLRHFAVIQMLAAAFSLWWPGWQGSTWSATWPAAVGLSITAPLLFSCTHPGRATRSRERLAALLLGLITGTVWSTALTGLGQTGAPAISGLGIGFAVVALVSVATLAATRTQAWLGYGYGLGLALYGGFSVWEHAELSLFLVPLGGTLLLTTIVVAWATRIGSSAYDRQLEQSLELDEQSAVLVALADKVASLSLAGPATVAQRSTATDTVPSPYAACSEAFQTAILEVTASGELVYLNAMARELCGFHRKPRGEPIDAALPLFDEGVPVSLSESVAEVAKRDSPRVLNGDYTLRHHDGNRRFTVEVQLLPCADTAAANRHVMIELTDLTEFHSLSHIARYHDTHDRLTGLPNRRTFMQRINETTQRAAETTPSAVCFIDLDHLDIVNDTCGHAAGDAVLRQVAHRLAEEFRATDSLTRVGGDQFAALLEDCSGVDALRIAQQLAETVRGLRFEWNDRVLEISASIGVADTHTTLAHYSDTFSAAHAASREARRRGGNQAYLHDPALHPSPRAAEVATWIERLRDAIREDRFQLQVQPIMPLDPASKLPACGELLVRIVDESGEALAPKDFISAAEHYDVMPDVDRWVVAHAIDAIAANAPGLAGLSPVAINLSGRSVGDPDMLSFINDELERSGIDTDRLSFEITETAVVGNFDAARHFITTLTDKGCHFSLDDFGTGFSSFLYVKNLPVDAIKIDGGFVRNLAQDAIDQALVSSIRQMGHMLGMRVVAEHVESQEVLDWLRQNGVDYGQGTLLGSPRPVH